MSGIYIHIPYCRQKCHYCNFFSLATSRHRNELVPALKHELSLRQEYLSSSQVSTIYFGGGTPSVLKSAEIQELLASINSVFQVENDAEITLEANPDDLTKQKLYELKTIGINRLSIGVQSFEDKDLQFLHRDHTGRQALNSVKRSQDAGFSNLSIDLIYGIPTLDSVAWESNLLKALELYVPHISAYALTVEERTPLAVLISKGKIPEIDESVQEQHFNLLVDLLEAHGYLHYEISNFSRPGSFSRHNTAYWKGISYLGIGPSAHSYNGSTRQWNVSNLAQYIESIQQNKIPFELETLTKAQRFNEYVMTMLRTIWGIDLNVVQKKYGHDWVEQALKDSAKFIEAGQLILQDQILYLTRKGKFLADGIAAELFRVGNP